MSTSKKETTTKTAAKKVAASPKKTSTTTSKEGQINAKKIGANLIVTVVGTTERYSRKVSQEQYDTIANEILAYNKRPSATRKTKIIELLTPETAKKKKEVEKTEAQVKGLKKQAKKQEKTQKVEEKVDRDIAKEIEHLASTDETAIPKLQAILDKFKKKPEPVAAETSSPRGGEAYRNRY